MSLQSSKVPCERFSTGSGIKNTTAPTSLDQQGQQTQLDSASSSSAALGEEHTVKNWSAKPSLPSVFYRTLGKGEPRGHSAKKSDRHSASPVDGRFAGCEPYRHSAKIFYFFLKKFFAECPLSDPRQRCFIFFSKNSLPSAPCPALGKVWIFFKKIFAECPLAGTRQSLIFF